VEVALVLLRNKLCFYELYFYHGDTESRSRNEGEIAGKRE
jgi:hypothetical protein